MILTLLRKFDSATLRRLAGPTILKAIQSVQPSNVEKEIAQIVLQKFDTRIISQKEIRLAILDTFSSDQAAALCSKLNLTAQGHIACIQSLQDYFSSSFSERKSKEFIDFLQLDEKYVYRKEIEHRAAKFVVEYDPELVTKTKPYLHAYQKRVKDGIVEKLSANGRRFIVQMPTGSGKTYTALEAIVDVLRLPRQNKFAVWIVDSPELSEQTLESFEFLWRLKGDRPLEVSRLFGGFEPPFSQMNGGMVFTSFDKFHSILNNDRHRAHADLQHLIQNSSLLVVDEAHSSVANTHLRCIKAFINTDACDVVGLTATPGRASQASTEELASLYTKNIIEITDERNQRIADPIRFLQSEHYLAEIKTELLETAIEILDDDEAAILATLAQNEDRNRRIVEQIELAHKLGESTVVFACNLDHVLALMILCRHKGIHAEFITGEVGQAERLDILDRFKKKQFNILINLELLSTGIDIPKLNRLIISRPVGSPILYSQIIGRALRGPKNGGNAINTVINVRDNLRNYPNAAFLYRYFDEEWSVV